MIDFENDLRDRLDRAASGTTASPDLMATIERRIVSAGRRAAALRVSVVAFVLIGAVAAAVTVGGGDDAGPTRAAESTDSAERRALSSTIPLPPGTVPVAGWSAMAEPSISPRSQFLAVDMDGEVLVWGGHLDVAEDEEDNATDGALYLTASNTWRPVAPSPLDFGMGAIGTWTGEEAVVLVTDTDSDARAAAAYAPATDSWRELADPPDVSLGDAVSNVLWTGSEVLVISNGGDGDSGSVVLYDPDTDTWRAGAKPEHPVVFGDAVWTGTEAIVVGRGLGPTQGPDAADMVASVYDPTENAWRSIPWGLDGGLRNDVTVVWTGRRVFVGGGYVLLSDGQGLADAALLDPATGDWEQVPDAPAGYAGNGRGRDPWTGSEVLTLASPDGVTTTAQLFDPAAGTWRTDQRGAGPGPGWGAGWGHPVVVSAGRVVFPFYFSYSPTP